MEHIKALFLLAHDNTVLVFIIAILATFLESFIPALPLIAIVIMNAALLGFWPGVIASTIGSCVGTLCLFLLANKFRHLKYFDKVRNGKTNKVANYINNQNYIILYLCYLSPFVPSCLVSIASGFLGKSLKSFLPGMVLGKMTMFLVASYIGYDINGLIYNPQRILIILVMIAVSFLIGKRISFKITNTKSSNIDIDNLRPPA